MRVLVGGTILYIHTYMQKFENKKKKGYLDRTRRKKIKIAKTGTAVYLPMGQLPSTDFFRKYNETKLTL